MFMELSGETEDAPMHDYLIDGSHWTGADPSTRLHSLQTSFTPRRKRGSLSQALTMTFRNIAEDRGRNS